MLERRARREFYNLASVPVWEPLQRLPALRDAPVGHDPTHDARKREPGHAPHRDAPRAAYSLPAAGRYDRYRSKPWTTST